MTPTHGGDRHSGKNERFTGKIHFSDFVGGGGKNVFPPSGGEINTFPPLRGEINTFPPSGEGEINTVPRSWVIYIYIYIILN